MVLFSCLHNYAKPRKVIYKLSEALEIFVLGGRNFEQEHENIGSGRFLYHAQDR